MLFTSIASFSNLLTFSLPNRVFVSSLFSPFSVSCFSFVHEASQSAINMKPTFLVKAKTCTIIYFLTNNLERLDGQMQWNLKKPLPTIKYQLSFQALLRPSIMKFDSPIAPRNTCLPVGLSGR